MNPMPVCFSFLEFLIFLSQYVSAQNSGGQTRVEEGFVPFKEARECFPLSSVDPQCSFSIKRIKQVTGGPVQYKCIRDVNNTAPVLRVQGDFHRFKIQCSSHLPIDFLYYGILPNEGIFVNWWKEIDLTSERLESAKDRFVVEVEVYSVQALFHYYNNPNNSLYEDKHDELPYQVKHDYPRTGNYTFPGIFDPATDAAFYFILEDGAKPEFLRNNRTIARLDSSNQLLLPCISSHLEATVELTSSPTTEPHSYNPIRGLTIAGEPGKNYDGAYTCALKYGGDIVDSLTLHYEQGKTSYLSGFIEVTTNPFGLFIDMERLDHGSHTGIKPKCIRTSIDDNLPDNKILVSVPMHNFGYMRLRQLFALPEYFNRSFTARTTSSYDVLIRTMKIESATTLRMLTVYCRYGSSSQIADFGASVTVHVSVPFAFGRDWAKFDRRTSAASTHFVLGLLKKDQILYTGTQAAFFCKVNIPVVVRPVVWYTQRRNGSYIREFVDYDLDQDVSIFRMRLTEDLKEVLCYGSYWYSSWFRNISMPLTLQDGMLPEITSAKTKYSFLENTGIGSIKCEATGKPRPRVTFRRNGVLVGDSRLNEYILELEHIDESAAGIYVCLASSPLGTVEKEFIVEVDYGTGGLIIGIGIAIPVIVFLLTLLGAFAYIKFFRPEQTGLTRAEIEDFIKGIKEGEFCGNKGEYAHDFAHLVPYTGDYEISPNHFKIDLTKVLGSGAYGLVLRGLLDEKDVAVKTVKRNADKQYLKALLSELKIMIYLGNHPNLIQIMGAYTRELSKGIVYVFVKYVPHGSLENYLRSHKSYFLGSTEYMNTIANRLDADSFGVDDLLRWATEVASGMDYLSSRKVIHGDLAARNLLLDQDKTVRITDFGLSRQLYDYSDYVKKNQEPLPWRWMALESLKYLSFSTSSDVWSFGVTIWEIFSLGEVPYPGYTWNLQFIEELESGLRMSRPKYASNLIYVLMSHCWHKVPEKRPTFSVLKERLTEIMNRGPGSGAVEAAD